MIIRAPQRAGAALILAIILLAGLLLLGLPFLFSQSASLAGTRSLAHQQQATVGRDAAENLGLAVGGESVRRRFLVDGNETMSSLATPGPVPLEQVTPNSFGLHLVSTSVLPSPLNYNASAVNSRLLGSLIADEQGKLDVNHMSVAAWSRLLEAVKIRDWDDNLVWDSDDSQSDPAGDVPGIGNGPDDDTMPDRNLVTENNGDNDDGDPFGELAEALSVLRFDLPQQRITSLDQLLKADTRHWKAVYANPNDYTDNSVVDYPNEEDRYGFRRPLTRAELDLLRPFLTVHLLAQGRLGLIDIGSTIAAHPN